MAGYSWYHLFVTAWERNTTGARATYSAFPSNENASPAISRIVGGMSASDSSKSPKEDHVPSAEDSSDFGTIKFHFSPEYLASGEFSPGNKFVTLKDDNTDYNAKLLAGSMMIDRKNIQYVETGPNSNSFAMSIVRYAGLPKRKPSVNAPGDGIYLI
jgi:hypothetical protein